MTSNSITDMLRSENQELSRQDLSKVTSNSSLSKLINSSNPIDMVVQKNFLQAIYYACNTEATFRHLGYEKRRFFFSRHMAICRSVKLTLKLQLTLKAEAKMYKIIS